MQWIREKFGAAIVSGIIGLIALVFVFYGVFNPSRTRGFHEGAVAGTVNGEPISVREYQQTLNQRLEYFKGMFGGKLDERQLQAFGIQDQVFKSLVQRRLEIQEARRLGLEASDVEVMQAIQEIPAFQKDGKFNLVAYKQMIEGSPYGNTGNFERVVRDDLSVQGWTGYFQRRVSVSDEEARQEFLLTRDKRAVKYVLLTTEVGRKGVEVKPDEIKKYLANPTQMNLVKSQFEARKATEFKGKTLEAVQDGIAHDLIASEHFGDAQKVNDKLAEQVLGILTADHASDARVDAILKPYGVQVKNTGLFSRDSRFISGIGDAKELLSDAFASPSVIDPAQNGHAKKYSTASGTVIAILTEAQRPDLSKFDLEREGVIRQIASRKEKMLYEDWMKGLYQGAKVDRNPDVVRSGSEAPSEG